MKNNKLKDTSNPVHGTHVRTYHTATPKAFTVPKKWDKQKREFAMSKKTKDIQQED